MKHHAPFGPSKIVRSVASSDCPNRRWDEARLVSDTKDAANPLAALRSRRLGRSSSNFGRYAFKELYVKNLQAVTANICLEEAVIIV